MIRKFRGFVFIRGLCLLVAISLLFMGIFMSKGLSPIYRPELHSGENTSYPFQFAVLSDLHKGWGVFKPIMKEIAKSGDSFAIIGGDIVAQNKEDRYRFVMRELERVWGTKPLYFVPGNHDVYDYADNAEYSLENYRKYCGPEHYWFSWGNTAFVVINDSQSRLTKGEFQWLQDTLRMVRGDFTHIVVVMHVPPFDPREDQSYCLPKSDGEKFMALMEKYGVDYVFSGHIHCYFKEIINGVTYIICGGAGGGLKCADGFYHYVRVCVQDQNIEDSVVKVKKNWWIEIVGDMKYDVLIRHPFFIPLLTVVMGQSFFYFLLF
jgi:Icc protein